MTTHMRAIERMIDALQRAFDDDATYGTPLRRSLGGLSEEHARAHPVANVHSILEIVTHVCGWIDVARRRLEGEMFKPKEEDDWPDVARTTWTAAVEELERAHSKLLDIVARMKPDDLDATVAGKSYTVADLLQFVIQHNIYHAGQIALLKRAMSNER